MTRNLPALLLAACLLAAGFLPAGARAAEPGSEGAAYIRLDDAWKGFWPHGAEYVEYSVGADAQPQDAMHVMLRPGMGMMLTYADKKNFTSGKNLLEAHREWELAYWRKNAGKVESKNREDLAGGKPDVLVTEIALPQQDGPDMVLYLVGAAARNGVFVFALSPVTADDDAMVRQLVASIKVQHKRLDLKAEARKYAPAAGKQQ